MSSTTRLEPTIEVRAMNRGTAREFERVYVFCPNGHEGSSAPITSRTGRQLLARDFSEEWCGNIGCEFSLRNGGLTGAA